MANPSADLLRAIKCNDIAAAHIAIRAGADPDPQSAGGEWPLDLALSKRSYELMDALIAAGADVNRQFLGQTLLLKAVRTGDDCLVAWLLERGASPHLAATPSESPLLAAAERAHLEIMKLLIEGGIDVNNVDRYEETALSRCFHLPDAVAALQLLGALPREVEMHLIAPHRFSRDFSQPAVQNLISRLRILCSERCIYDHLVPGTAALIVSREFSRTGVGEKMSWLSECGHHAERIAQEFIDEVRNDAVQAGCLVFSAGTGDARGVFVSVLPTTDKYAAMATMRIRDPFDGPGTYGLIRGFKLWETEFPFQLRGCEMQSLVIFSDSVSPFPKAAPKRLNQIFQDIRQPGQDCPIFTWHQSGSFARIDWNWENL